MQDESRNISLDHQPRGSAINIADTLDRNTESVDRPAERFEKTAEDYRREFGDNPDSATVSHAPPPASANRDA